MTIQEALAQGVSTTGVGLAIVFSVLVILMLVMMVMKKVFYKAPKAVSEPQTVIAEQKETMDEGELIAVLTAAVAASLNTSTYNLQIKSYKRAEGSKSAWQKAGISETINSRF